MAIHYLLLNKTIAPNLSYDSISRGSGITAVEDPQPGQPIPIVWGSAWIDPYTAWYYYSHVQYARPGTDRLGTWVYTRRIPTSNADALRRLIRQYIFSARMILCRGEVDRIAALRVANRPLEFRWANARLTTFFVEAPFFLGGEIGEDGGGGLGAYYQNLSSLWGVVNVETDSKAATLRSPRDGTLGLSAASAGRGSYNQYRGVTSLSFPAFNFGGGQALPPWRVLVERIDKLLDGKPQWYPATAEPNTISSELEGGFTKLRIFFVVDTYSPSATAFPVVIGTETYNVSRRDIAYTAIIRFFNDVSRLPLDEIVLYIIPMAGTAYYSTWRRGVDNTAFNTYMNNTIFNLLSTGGAPLRNTLDSTMNYIKGRMDLARAANATGYRNIVVMAAEDLATYSNIPQGQVIADELMNDAPYIGDYSLSFHAFTLLPTPMSVTTNLPQFDSDGIVPTWQSSDEYKTLTRDIYPALHVATTINPVHALREIMTDSSFDFRYRVADIDDVSWRAAALRIYNEEWGMALAWNGINSRNLARSILDYIDGEIYFDTATNKLKMYLMRGDDIATTITTADIREVTNLKLTDPRSRPNTVTVGFVAAYTGERDSVTVQDIVAVTANNGAKVEVNIDYLCCPTQQLASRAAARDLASLSASGLSFDVAVVSAEGRHRGQLLDVELTDLNVPSARMRIADISDDADREGGAILSLVEDGIEYDTARVAASYIGTEPRDPTPPDPLPPPTLTAELFLYEAALPHVLKSGITLANIKRAVAADFTSAMLAWATNVTPWVSPSVSTPTRPALKMANVGRLQSSITISQRSSVITILNQNIAYTVDFTDRRTWLLLIGEGETQEVVRVSGIIQTRAGVTLMQAELHGRGLWDTVNHAHAAGSPVIAIGDMHVENSAYNTATSPLMFRATVSSNAITTEVSETFTPSLNRLHRPLPPAYFDGRYPRTFGDYTGAITLTWQNRSRDMTWQQLSYHNMTPRTLETNQVTRVRIMKDSRVLHTLTTASETNTFSVAFMLSVANSVSTGARQLVGARFVVDSWRDGVTSWQYWELPFAWRADTTVPKTGWGENWGDDWDGA